MPKVNKAECETELTTIFEVFLILCLMTLQKIPQKKYNFRDSVTPYY
jgi:hypothetical protein